jgi:hypothetical protein
VLTGYLGHWISSEVYCILSDVLGVSISPLALVSIRINKENDDT